MSVEFNFSPEYSIFFTNRPRTDSDSISGNISVTIYPLWYKQNTLEWSIPVFWGDCVFNVYKSATESDDFIKVNQQPIDANFLKDTTGLDASKFFPTWYIIEAIMPDGRTVASPSTTWQNTRNSWVELRAAEIQRREWLLLSKFTGVDSYIFRQKTYGKRCSECWSFQLEKSIKDNCKTCMGTTFEGGYFPGVRTFIQYETSPNKISLEYFGKFENNQLSAWTISVPEMEARDVVYRVPDGAIFLVNDWANTELQTVTVRQILQLTQQEKKCAEFQLLIANDLIPDAYQT